ncbi:MAG: HNH endonuclease [Proteobacteria bacterium]|nr:HNH endonuclease [Pseudomonadota bacterium]MBU1389325.1 HNH endonuclease [Pseudomonadota bacterium]MBU1544145.1 HNH endonuclease [Pseudomonadota bacterium]MBU2429557.1 HNH endonuclease [Pseudomonadota bacterium]MBU2482718.1 HNH endonuclease [Pseudomonadota bacterium]
MSFPPKIVHKVLIDCKRSCSICHKFCGTKIELHHIKPVSEGGEDSYENCIPLCFDCHSDVRAYDEKHPKGRKYTESELIMHKTNWYKQVKSELENTEFELPPQANDPEFRELMRQFFVKKHGREASRKEIDELLAKSIIETMVERVSSEKFDSFFKEFDEQTNLGGAKKPRP